jgi:hypothetical protein
MTPPTTLTSRDAPDCRRSTSGNGAARFEQQKHPWREPASLLFDAYRDHKPLARMPTTTENQSPESRQSTDIAITAAVKSP